MMAIFSHSQCVNDFVSFVPLELKKLETSYTAVDIVNEDSVASYYKIRQQLAHLNNELQAFIHKPQYILPFLQPGRLAKVVNGDMDFDWGIVVNFQKKPSQSKVTWFVLLNG